MSDDENGGLIHYKYAIVVAVPGANQAGTWGDLFLSFGCAFADVKLGVSVHDGNKWSGIQPWDVKDAAGRLVKNLPRRWSRRTRGPECPGRAFRHRQGCQPPVPDAATLNPAYTQSIPSLASCASSSPFNRSPVRCVLWHLTDDRAQEGCVDGVSAVRGGHERPAVRHDAVRVVRDEGPSMGLG
ncbi:hypothetical protein [Streptomyces sp. WM6378]|uniref:hypothetical protein n=1 Tax=Streptomyces sp. WM6378 TaxID=1415557 RepID=UPI000AFBFD8D|nr:hypothetical protein [Streptomyces sp. WM6378]